jgi:hypothetical protein
VPLATDVDLVAVGERTPGFVDPVQLTELVSYAAACH